MAAVKEPIAHSLLPNEIQAAIEKFQENTNTWEVAIDGFLIVALTHKLNQIATDALGFNYIRKISKETWFSSLLSAGALVACLKYSKGSSIAQVFVLSAIFFILGYTQITEFFDKLWDILQETLDKIKEPLGKVQSVLGSAMDAAWRSTNVSKLWDLVN